MTSGTPLRLASEYEAAFMRAALDDLLLNSIADNGYRPGNLHRMLLSLPWADVFTTNYDTLLERTRPFIHDRKYDLVLDTPDIPVASRPRIVKLHGSFPSQRPFVITEEDFRTYPRRFSPLVNLVQQSVMENVFCLLGFSGDDPNFLNWTGWVRDHLGNHTQPIYLCGILNLSPFQRRLLEGRNVIPIDLSPLFPQSLWPDEAMRHTKALEWLLLTLLHGAPPNLVRWPKTVSGNTWEPAADLPSLSPGSRPLSPLGERSPKAMTRSLSCAELGEVYDVWSQNRKEYPGWVVLPKDNREDLWDFTKYWFEPILNSIDQLSAPRDLLLLAELNWRIEKTLSHYPPPHADIILRVINQYNPFPNSYGNSGQFRPDNIDCASLPWPEITDCWLELQFAIIRHWRETLNAQRFLTTMEQLRESVKQRGDWASRWYYEYCLFFLAQSDFNRLRPFLADWKMNSVGPFWKTRKAAVMAELGQINEARQLAEDALATTRSQFVPGETDYTLLSQEGWTMLLLRSIKMNEIGQDLRYLDQFTDRWEKLTSHRCNPWIDIEALERVVKGMTPPTDLQKSIKRGYHPKTARVTYQMMGETAYSQLQPAFNFLRMFEEGGIPIRAGATALFTNAVLNAAKCVQGFAPALSLSFKLRAANSPEDDNWLDLATVGGLSDDEVGSLYQVFRNSFIEALNHLTRHPEEVGGFLASTAFRRAQTFAELLSRLAARLAEAQLEEVLQLAASAYLAPVVRSHHSLHKCQKVLFERSLQAASTEHQIRILPQLLSLPLPGETGFEVSSEELWHEPFADVHMRLNSKAISTIDHAALQPTIANLIAITGKGGEQSRWRAILRLSHLHEIKVLTAQETAQFAQALWAQLDDSGLPKDNHALKTISLILPEPQLGLAKEKVKAYLLSQEFYRQARQHESPDQGASFGIAFGPQNLTLEWCRATTQVPVKGQPSSNHQIDWSSSEAAVLLDKAVSWWDEQKRFLNDPAAIPMISDNLHRDFTGLVDLLMKVVMPRLKVDDTPHCDVALTLITELDENGIVVLPVLPFVLPLKPELYQEVASRIQAGMFSNESTTIDGALLGLRDWIIYSIEGRLPAPPPHFLDHLVSIIAARSAIAVDRALMYLTDILITVPEVLEERHLELVLLGLGSLIAETDVSASGGTGTIESPDKPYLRLRAAKLARQLSRYYEDCGTATPSTIENWRIVIENDPLAEVRSVWTANPNA
jgi:hypothetical protein